MALPKHERIEVYVGERGQVAIAPTALVKVIDQALTTVAAMRREARAQRRTEPEQIAELGRRLDDLLDKRLRVSPS